MCKTEIVVGISSRFCVSIVCVGVCGSMLQVSCIIACCRCVVAYLWFVIICDSCVVASVMCYSMWQMRCSISLMCYSVWHVCCNIALMYDRQVLPCGTCCDRRHRSEVHIRAAHLYISAIFQLTQFSSYKWSDLHWYWSTLLMYDFILQRCIFAAVGSVHLYIWLRQYWTRCCL